MAIRKRSKIKYRYFEPELIITLAKSAGYGYEALGDVLNLHPSMVFRKIQGNNPFTITEVEKLADFLRVDIIKLFPYVRRNFVRHENSA